MSIRLEHVNYVYGADTELSVAALKDVCLTIEDGEFVGLIGHTGSGKSTLVQHLNGLLKATDGKIYYNGTNIYEKGYNLKELRSFLKSTYFRTSVSAPKTWVFLKKRWKSGRGGRWNWWESERSIIISLPLTCPADRKEGWPSPVCSP